MTKTEKPDQTLRKPLLKLAPRFAKQGYTQEAIKQRRAWIEEFVGHSLPHVAACSLTGESMRGNMENPIGSAQMPLGIAGPLSVQGQHAQGTFYVPLATTEGALVRSYERGMVTLSRSGGVQTHVYRDENRIAPVFFFDDIAQAAAFCERLDALFPQIREQAESTTRHGKLVRLETHPTGRQVSVQFCFQTGDAHGMNMIAAATEKACQWLLDQGIVKRFQLFSGMSSEKKQSGNLMAGGKGKTVCAGATIPAKTVRTYLHSTPEALVDLWQSTVTGHLRAQTMGYNGHMANGLAAMFIACGQDVANLVNSAVGVTLFEVTDTGDLYASVTLPSLTVATVGGGVGLGTSRECLEILGCFGNGKAQKFAEIIAATLLAGELSFGAAIASGEFVQAHESYGRNRPEPH